MSTMHAPHRLFNPEKENALPSKTPGLKRVLGGGGPGAKTAGPRTQGKVPQAGPSTVYRDFNVLNTGKREAGGGKGMMGREGKEAGTPNPDIAPKRLFTQQLPAPSLKPSRSFTSFAPPPTTRKPVAAPPTTRKAGPAPARDFATPNTTKIAQAQTPAPAPLQLSATPLPSASRRRRSRHSNTPGSDGLGSSTRGLGPGFVTPPRQILADGSFEMGDESFEGPNVSGGSLGVGSAGLVEVAEEEESDGEVEYMPPKVVPLPEQLLEDPLTPEEIERFGAQIRRVRELGPWLVKPDRAELPPPAPIDVEATLREGGFDETGENARVVCELPEDKIWASYEQKVKEREEAKRAAEAAVPKPSAIRLGQLNKPIRPSPLAQSSVSRGTARPGAASSTSSRLASRAPASRPTGAFARPTQPAARAALAHKPSIPSTLRNTTTPVSTAKPRAPLSSFKPRVNTSASSARPGTQAKPPAKKPPVELDSDDEILRQKIGSIGLPDEDGFLTLDLGI